MKLSEYFSSVEIESAQAVQELEEHMSGWPAVQREYARLDEKCVEYARELAPLQLAGSPLALEAEVALHKARLEREGGKATFQRTRNLLQNRVEAFTRKEITDAHLAFLDRARDVGKYYRFVWQDSVTNIFDDRKRVKVRHNIAALDAAKNRIFAGIKEIQAMRHKPLTEVRAKIAELEMEFAGFRFSTMEVEEVSESVARDMKPVSPAVALNNEKISNLNARLSALERK
jgi:hypothetical protein